MSPTIDFDKTITNRNGVVPFLMVNYAVKYYMRLPFFINLFV